MRVVDENKKATGETFNVVLGKSRAVITSSTQSEYCGVSAMFSGNWVRSQEEAGDKDEKEVDQDAL